MKNNQHKKRIAVLTSGGDAPGMNAAVRAIVRTALNSGAEIYAVKNGYKGLVDAGDQIQKLDWDSVGGIMQRGGTVIGTARCHRFRTREGRKLAAKNMIERGIDGLALVGGDGSLMGANIFHEEWGEYLDELVQEGQIDAAAAKQYPAVQIVGLPGSIDNDIFGSDMTIGADTALHRITEAIDSIASTAASHQRSFVVEVMGRNCGYLALMGGLASSADWVFIPENALPAETWKTLMVNNLKKGRAAGRQDSIVIVSEGAKDQDGNLITCQEVKEVIEENLQEEVRITILGHVQRGGSPSVYDRNLGTLLGHAAVETLLTTNLQDDPVLVGTRGNRIVRTPLDVCIRQSRDLVEAVQAKDDAQVVALRGESFQSVFDIIGVLTRPGPRPAREEKKSLRLAVMNAGAPAPGMNAAVRTAVRMSIDSGHTIYGVRNGFRGLISDHIAPMQWMDVNGWMKIGGSLLGTNRDVPENGDLYAIARTIEKYQLDGLLIIGGEAGYEGAHVMVQNQERFPSFQIPILCLPSTIDNDRPGSELSLGADTALNSIIEALDKIKQSAVASQRSFVVEVMGGRCGYLALMSGLASGAERVYINEEALGLYDLTHDLDNLVAGFEQGKRLGLLIRNEQAHDIYTTDFICRLLEAEGGDLFDVRQAILGHLQQGGNPSPFDRVQASRLAALSIEYLINETKNPVPDSAFIGFLEGDVVFTNMVDYPRLADRKNGRPKKQWWLALRAVERSLAFLEPKS
ncbi:MAG: 6-phosphofructokinase [Chloroflexota bacterium]